MIKAFAITLALALAVSGTAVAKPCRDDHGKFMKCPPPAMSEAPHCKIGKPCGKSCIAKDKICHKPG